MAAKELALYQRITGLETQLTERDAREHEFNLEIKALKSKLEQKADQETRLNNTVHELEVDKAKRIAEGTRHKDELQKMEKNLIACQHELQVVSAQLYEMQDTQIAQLKRSSSWAAAAKILEAVVKRKEKELTEINPATDAANATALTKALCSSQRQLGEFYMKAADLKKAEFYTRKSYNERLKLFGKDSETTRFTMKQLCKILCETHNNVKINEAAAFYQPFWDKHFAQPQDRFFLECGHELGCLRVAQGRAGEALPILREVWEHRRNHSSSSVKKLSMSTVEELLALENASGRIVILEKLWDSHSGELAGTAMLKHADALASIYWKKGTYAKAKPILSALWEARIGNVKIPSNMSSAEKTTRLGDWFVTGYRYATTLTNANTHHQVTEQSRDELYISAKAVLEKLWTERAKLPNTVAAEVTIFMLADYYADTLLYLGNATLAEEVAGTTWRNATATDSAQVINESILDVGEQYAKALNVKGDGRSDEAKDMYKLLFGEWKKLSQQHPRNRDLAACTINCGRSLLDVLQARNRHSKLCKDVDSQLRTLEDKLEELEKSQPQLPAPPRPLAIEPAPQ